MKRCTNELIAQGHITPRSCELCGIGPCKFYGNRVGDTGPVLALAYATQKDMKSQQQLDSNFQPKKDEAMKDIPILTRSLIPADPNTKGMRVKCDRCGIDASCLTCNHSLMRENFSHVSNSLIERVIKLLADGADYMDKEGNTNKSKDMRATAFELTLCLPGK